jgi:hypothetical protein
MSFIVARLEHAARTFLRGDLPQRRARAAVERDLFDGADALADAEAEGEVHEPDCNCMSFGDAEDAQYCDTHRCPKCPHWNHTGKPCAACSCVSIFMDANTTYETGSRWSHATTTDSVCAWCYRRDCNGTHDPTPLIDAFYPQDPAPAHSPRAVVADGPSPVVPPDLAGEGPTHSLADLIYAAENQLALWHGGARMTPQRYKYLAELIPELRSAANNLPAQLGSQCGAEPEEGSADTTQPSETAPSSGQVLRDARWGLSPLIRNVLSGHDLQDNELGRYCLCGVQFNSLHGKYFLALNEWAAHATEIVLDATATALDALQK